MSNETETANAQFTAFPVLLELSWRSDNSVRNITITTIITNLNR